MNVISNKNSSYFKGCGYGSGRGPQRGYCRPAQYNKSQRRNTLAPNHSKGKKPMRKNDGFRYGMNGHWAHVCRTSKHFLDLYQTSINRKGKRFETHSIENAYDTTNIEVNNALMEDIPTNLVNDNPSALTK